MNRGMNFPYWLGWHASRMLTYWLGHVAIEGRDNVPTKGPVLIAPTHVNALDPFVVGATLGRPVWYMSKAEMFSFPLLGIVMKALNAFPVRRGQIDRGAIRKSLGLLQSGDALLLFPEGTRNKHRYLRPAQLGVALLSMKTGTPIVPTAVFGTDRMMPEGALFPRPSRVEVHFASPIHPGDYGASNARRADLSRLAEELMRVLSEMTGRPYRAGPARGERSER